MTTCTKKLLQNERVMESDLSKMALWKCSSVHFKKNFELKCHSLSTLVGRLVCWTNFVRCILVRFRRPASHSFWGPDSRWLHAPRNGSKTWWRTYNTPFLKSERVWLIKMALWKCSSVHLHKKNFELKCHSRSTFALLMPISCVKYPSNDAHAWHLK